ncbi:MAG: Gfo/Idh/MocA family oxidoreductase [Pseudomonadota bacterium]
MSERMRLGLVGAGAIAGAYVDAIAAGKSAELVAVADTNAEAANAMAEKAGCVAFPSHLALAESGLCDAVIVTTPPSTHEQVAVDLLSAKLPVLCEKPLSVDLKSAFNMTRAATENGVLLSMASKFRFCDDVVQVHDMLKAGEIGTPTQLDNVFTGVVDMTKRWNSDPELSGGGVLIDNGTHSVDIVRYLLGSITEVQAIAGPRMQQMLVEDSVTLMARTEDGKQARIETSWSVHKDLPWFIAIYGTEGSIEIGWKGSRIRRGRTGAWENFGTGYDKVASFKRQIDHFVGVLQGGDYMLPDAHDALSSVLVIQAAYRSMTRGAWTRVEHWPRPANVPVAVQVS